jgi:hypothetical protein
MAISNSGITVQGGGQPRIDASRQPDEYHHFIFRSAVPGNTGQLRVFRRRIC